MNISVSLLLTDVLPHKKRFLNRFVKSRIFDKLSHSEIFSQLKNAGVDGVELLLPADASFDDLVEARNLLEKHNIKVFSVHQALRFITKTKPEEVAELFTAADIFKSKVVVLHMNTVGRQIFKKNYISTLKMLEKKHKIKIGFENREKFFASRLSTHGWDEIRFPSLMEKVGFKMTLDTCHLGQTGGDIINFFKKNKKRIVNIHLSDYRAHYLNNSLRPLRFKHLPLGHGDLPIKEFIKVLKTEKYQGLLTLEINSDLDEILNSLRFIKNSK